MNIKYLKGLSYFLALASGPTMSRCAVFDIRQARPTGSLPLKRLDINKLSETHSIMGTAVVTGGLRIDDIFNNKNKN